MKKKKNHWLQPTKLDEAQPKVQMILVIQARCCIQKKDQLFLAFINKISTEESNKESKHLILKDYTDVFPDHLLRINYAFLLIFLLSRYQQSCYLSCKIRL